MQYKLAVFFLRLALGLVKNAKELRAAVSESGVSTVLATHEVRGKHLIRLTKYYS